MAGRVASPSAPGDRQLKRLGVYQRVIAGTETITVPRGTTMVYFEMKGGGGAGGTQRNNEGGKGGGEAQTERRFIRLRETSITVTIGRGGQSGTPAYQGQPSGNYFPAENSSVLGYVARAGQAGTPNIVDGVNVEGVENSQPGSDGPDMTRFAGMGTGLGNFTGASCSGRQGGGPFGGVVGGFAVNPAVLLGFNGSYGCGGGGAAARLEFSTGGAGGDGYIVMEFFG